MREHVSRTAQVCFFHRSRLRFVRRQIRRDVTIELVVVLVFSQLDSCNAVLAADILAITQAPLQRDLHAAPAPVGAGRPPPWRKSCPQLTGSGQEIFLNYKLLF